MFYMFYSYIIWDNVPAYQGHFLPMSFLSSGRITHCDLLTYGIILFQLYTKEKERIKLLQIDFTCKHLRHSKLKFFTIFHNSEIILYILYKNI